MEKTVLVRDVQTRYVDQGVSAADVPIVLIHAVGLDHCMWADTTATLARTHRVIAYDVRGSGSATPTREPIDMPSLSDDLRELLDKLLVARVHLVGISMGGAIAQTFAVRHPSRVASLTLVATFSLPQPAFALRGESGLRDGMAAQIAPTLTRWFTPDSLAENARGVEYARRMLLAQDPSGWKASWMAMSKLDVHPMLPTLRIPTLAIAGELDASCPPALMYREIVARIPNTRFEIISGAAHMIGLSAPDALSKSIDRFCSGAGADPHPMI